MTDTGFFPQDDTGLRPRMAQVAGSRWPEARTPRTTINRLIGRPPAGAPLSRAGLASMLDLQTAGRPSHDPRAARKSARGLG